jgi:outer membrane protein assembly factor BamB
MYSAARIEISQQGVAVMEIQDRGAIQPGSIRQPVQGEKEAPQAFANISDAFQKSVTSSPAVDIRKAAGALLAGSSKKTAEVSWTKGLSVCGSPVLGPDGKLFVSDSYPDKALHAFDPKTGTEMWKKQIGGGQCQAPVLAPDGSLLVVAGDGAIHALDPADGGEKWKIPFGSSGGSLTVYDDGRASLVSDGNALSIDLKSRKITARTPLSHGFEAPPVIARDGTVYGGGHDGSVYALESGTGKEKWKCETGGMLRNSPTIGPDGTVYAGCIGGTLHAIDPTNGQSKWNFPTGSWMLPSPVIGQDGTVYVGNSDNMLYAVDPVSGKHKWEFYIGGELRVEPVPAENGLLYVVTDRNMVLCLDQESGLKLMQYHADSYVHCPPACDGNGNFFFGCNNGKLYAMNVPSIEQKAEFEKVAKNPEAEPLKQTGTVEQNDEFVVIDGIKLKVNREKTEKSQ